MKAPLSSFDMRELHAALDAARGDRQLTWVALTAEINRPFEGTPSIPISVGTVRGMRNKRTIASAVVLQILRWLGRTPESFLFGREGTARATAKLPEPGPGRILRFDTRAMYATLNAERVSRGLTWKQVASELPGFTESMLTNLAKGPLIGFPRVMMIPQWLALPAARFVRAHTR